MNKTSQNAKQQKHLDEVLAIYGADVSRWPADERVSLEKLIRNDKRAAKLVAEAGALDDLMSYAPRGQQTGGLQERIVAAALSDSEHEARVIPVDADSWRRHLLPGQGRFWPAAALAASFALGIYLGSGDLGSGAVNQALDLASLDSPSEEVEAGGLLSDVAGQDSDGLL